MTALLAGEPESALVARWLAGVQQPLRLEDGRALRVIFPGVPGPGHGPDVRDALLDASGDFLKGDVEVHLLASGWTAHRHSQDPAYARVVLHVVGHDDLGVAATFHGARAIPVLVLPPPLPAAPPGEGFTPPCVFEAARGQDAAPVLRALSLRRLRMKIARIEPAVDATGPAQALYAALLTTLGGPANGEAFAAIASRLPLAALLEFATSEEKPDRRILALGAALKGAALDLPLRRAGIRPAASPARRLEAAGALVHALWPPGSPFAWPVTLLTVAALPRVLRVGGIGRALAIELAVNAVLPVAAAASFWPEAAVEAAWFSLPSPGTYGHLANLQSWLSAGGSPPFRSAAALQAGLLLHAGYCSRGRCGRCPLSDAAFGRQP